MIETLNITNYALIDELSIDFHNNLNIITGETGAGKSIILGALSMLLGERADTKAVRNKEKKSIIEASFSITSYESLKQVCIDNDIDWDNETCILRREITPNGRSRAFINDTPVTLTLLQQVAMQLVDIHSQHQNLLLATPEYQMHIIDSLASNQSLLQEYSELYANYVTSVKKYNEAKRSIDKNSSDADFIRFQLQQLEEMNLVDGEQEELEREHDILSNITEIKQALNSAISSLSSGNSNALELIGNAVGDCESLSEVLDDAEALCARLESARIEIQDITETLVDFESNLNADPHELNNIEERLNNIYSLQHKHKVNSIAELIALREKYRQQLNTIDDSDNILSELEDKAKHAYRLALNKAKEISKRRHDEAKQFALTLKETALPLGMKNLQCDINITTENISSTGIDAVQFLFAFNKNQPLMPVGNTASGGEISRLMLSIKSIIANKMQLPSIIFDEVDTGVSGDVANRMGEMMQEISQNLQVIAITHLPQVAAKGAHHFKVYKEDDENSTLTRIKELNIEQRIEELALMLSGSSVNSAALANARSLLKI